MSRENKKNRWAGLIIGPTMTLFALSGLWKNEIRFDFHKAAQSAQIISQKTAARENENISFTGPMDQSLQIEGQYVEGFTGFLRVSRSAEIYAWDKSTDSDDRVTWNKRWMGSLESNSRNSSLRQQLSSTKFLPDQYVVGDFEIQSKLIEFVDSSTSIPASSLELTREGLQLAEEKFYLYKRRSDGMGDERVSYSGIPIPETATYFGKFSGGQGVADTTHQRTGFINMMIQDTGILHHLVAGDRDTALATMKAYIGRLKWIVRGVGTVVVVFGLFILFATIVGVLFHIPFIGQIARAGTFLLALAIGLPLAITTILLSYVVAHPLILVMILGLTVGTYLLANRRGKQSQQKFRNRLDQRFGDQLEVLDVKELEFLELARLAMSDSEFGAEEEAFLMKWTRKHGWSSEKTERMLKSAKESSGATDSVATDEHLANLIHLALADGALTQFEMNSIRNVAQKVGYDEKTIQDLTRQVRESVWQA